MNPQYPIKSLLCRFSGCPRSFEQYGEHTIQEAYDACSLEELFWISCRLQLQKGVLAVTCDLVQRAADPICSLQHPAVRVLGLVRQNIRGEGTNPVELMWCCDRAYSEASPVGMAAYYLGHADGWTVARDCSAAASSASRSIPAEKEWQIRHAKSVLTLDRLIEAYQNLPPE